MITCTVTTREGKTHDLAFNFPTLANVKEARRLSKADKFIESNEYLFAACAAEDCRPLISNDGVFLALAGSDLIDRLMETGTAVFQEAPEPAAESR